MTPHAKASVMANRNALLPNTLQCGWGATNRVVSMHRSRVHHQYPPVAVRGFSVLCWRASEGWLKAEPRVTREERAWASVRLGVDGSNGQPGAARGDQNSWLRHAAPFPSRPKFSTTATYGIFEKSPYFACQKLASYKPLNETTSLTLPSTDPSKEVAFSLAERAT